MSYRPLKDQASYIQLVSFGFLIFAGTVVFSLVSLFCAYLIWGMQAVESSTTITETVTVSQVNILKFIQTFAHIGMFSFPALYFAHLLNEPIGKYLGFNKVEKPKVLLMTVALVFLAMPISTVLTNINEAFKFPEALAGLENWLLQKEEMARILMENIARTTTISGLLINLFVMAFLPALGEELVFRGVLLKYAIKFTKRIHLSIFIIAVLFSAIHFQFYGFLPRLFLGLLLGYLFVWSGSIWVPMLFHFVNNGASVVAFYFITKSNSSIDIDSIGNITENWMWFVHIPIFIFALFFLYKNKKANALSQITIG